jgi:hypothetical protein
MKKVLFLFITSFFLVPAIAMAQTPADETKDKIDEIKDKVTTQVEKLDLVEKRGLLGVVESVNENQIRINDLNDKIRIIEVDELTKYSSEENNSFDLANIEKGAQISAIGIYNKDSEKLLARFLNEITIPIFMTGVISEKNEDEFTISIATEEEKNYLIDIENITKTYSYDETELSQSGFADLEIMQNVIVTGFSDVNEENRISATRVIYFPQIPKNPRISIEVSENETITAPSPTP